VLVGWCVGWEMVDVYDTMCMVPKCCLNPTSIRLSTASILIHSHPFQPTHLGVDQARVGEAGQASQVDVALLLRVVPGDVACVCVCVCVCMEGEREMERES
jgi:hypothetical protein